MRSGGWRSGLGPLGGPGFPEFLEEAAVAALDDLEHRERVRRGMVRERERLNRALAPFGQARVYRSHGNFTLVRFSEDVVLPVREALRAARIQFKWLSDPDCCARVSLGTSDENAAVRDVLVGTLSRLSASNGSHATASVGVRPNTTRRPWARGRGSPRSSRPAASCGSPMAPAAR